MTCPGDAPQPGRGPPPGRERGVGPLAGPKRGYAPPPPPPPRHTGGWWGGRRRRGGGGGGGWAVKPNGAILFFAQCPFDKVLGASNLAMLRYEWVWYKSRATGFLNANRAPLKKSENILVFYQKSPVYHPQFTYGEPYRKTNPAAGAVPTTASLNGQAQSPATGGVIREMCCSCRR